MPPLTARTAYMDLGGGEKAIVAVGRSKSASDAVPVIFCHGANGDALTARDQFFFDDLEPLAALGYPVIAADLAGGASWSNDASISAITSAVTWAGTNLGTRTDRVALFGDSMGGGLALNWAWRNPAQVAGIVLRVPVVALDAFHDRDAGFAAAIEAAYGGAAGYEAALVTHDPAANHALLAPLGPRIRVWYATADELIPTAETLAFTTAVGAEATPVTGTHLAGALTPPDVVAAWLARQITVNS